MKSILYKQGNAQIRVIKKLAFYVPSPTKKSSNRVSNSQWFMKNQDYVLDFLILQIFLQKTLISQNANEIGKSINVSVRKFSAL